jgi:nicotinamide-nucleotide amidase
MARGARTHLNAGVALATTGIAGPDGGTPEKPVGLVIFALDDGTERSRTWTFRFEGDRETIQRRATTTALNILWRYAKGQEP